MTISALIEHPCAKECHQTASSIATSPRKPVPWVCRLVAEALELLLETTDMAVDDISYAVGYQDASFFRRLIKRLTGLNPGRYRRMFKPLLTASPLQ